MKWVEFVKQYAKKHNLKYGEALKKAKGDWAEHKKTLGKSGGSFDPQGKRVPKTNVGKLVRKDADHRKDKPKNPNEKDQKGGNIKMTIQQGEKPLENTKAQRAKRVRQYNKALKEVASGLRTGKLDQEEFNDFVGLARSLQKSEKDKYAKAIKKITKEFNSKKYQKLLGKRRQTKLTPEQEAEQFQSTAKRTIALQTGAKVGAQQRKAINTRVEALKRLGVSEEDATNIANEEARQQQELKTLTAGLGGKRLTGAKIGMSYPQFIKSLQDKNNISYADAVQLASSNNLWKRYQIEQLKANPGAILGTFVPPVGQPTASVQASVDRRALLKKDGTLKKVHRDNVDKFLRTWGASSGAFNLNDRNAVLSKAKTINQAEKAQELAQKLSAYPTLNPLEKSRLEAISASLQGYIADPSTPFRRSGRPARGRTGATTAGSTAVGTTTAGSDSDFPAGVPPPPAGFGATPPPTTGTQLSPIPASPTLPATPSAGLAATGTSSPPATTTIKVKRKRITRKVANASRLQALLDQSKIIAGSNYRLEDTNELYRAERDDDGGVVLRRVDRRSSPPRALPQPPRAGTGDAGDDDSDGLGGALELDEDHHHHLDIAEQVHKSVESRNGSFGDYLYNKNASNADHAVYVNEPRKCVLIAIRGRKGNFDERKYQEDKHYVKEIKLLLPSYKIEITGIGKGAEYAEKIGRVERLPVVLFNHKNHKKLVKKNKRKGGSMSFGTFLEKASVPSVLGGGFDDAIVNHEVEEFKVHQGDFLHDNPEGGAFNFGDLMSGMGTGDFSKAVKDGMGSASAYGGSLVTSYSSPDIVEGELPENEDDGNRPEGEGEPPVPITDRQMESVLGSYGGSLDQLADEKVQHITHKTNQVRNEYTPQLVAMKAQSLDKLADFKHYHRTFDRKIGAIKTDLGILQNYISRIGDKHLRRDLARQSAVLKEELNNFLKGIRQVFAQNRTLKFKNRLGNDRSVLKDTSVEEAVDKGGGLIGGMSGTYQGSGSDILMPSRNPFVVANPYSGSGAQKSGRISNSSIRNMKIRNI